MKNIYLIILGVIILSVIFYFYSLRIDDEVMFEFADSFVTTDGVVTDVDLSGIAVDGPALITLEREGGGVIVVAVPSMGINLCSARVNIIDVGEIEIGDMVEVRGEVGVDGVIIPCESSDHYLRVVESV